MVRLSLSHRSTWDSRSSKVCLYFLLSLLFIQREKFLCFLKASLQYYLAKIFQVYNHRHEHRIFYQLHKISWCLIGSHWGCEFTVLASLHSQKNSDQIIQIWIPCPLGKSDLEVTLPKLHRLRMGEGWFPSPLQKLEYNWLKKKECMLFPAGSTHVDIFSFCLLFWVHIKIS